MVHTSSNLDKYGLQTFTPALCMGAKSDSGFSNERSREAGLSEAEARFVGDSLAGRLVAALRQNNLRGVKVTASNQLVANDGKGFKGIMNDLGIAYPPGGWRNTVSPDGRGATIPGVVWGIDPAAKREWNGLMDIARPESAEIAVGPTGRDLEFGRTDGEHGRVGTKIATLKNFLKKWQFDSWICREDTCFSQTTRRASSAKTLRLTPPPRIQRIEPVPSNSGKPTIKVIGRAGDDKFKWFKSYEIS